jgi:signal transduction histidine kinase
MKEWLRGKPGGVAAFVLIAGLVAGGLGWATSAALHLEQEQLEHRAAAERTSRVHLALWRMDGLISPYLAREDSRPFNHYSAIFAPPAAFRAKDYTCSAGEVLEPSPLLSAELPAWMQLHFQADERSGWTSPQVPAPAVAQLLQGQKPPIPLPNANDERRLLLARVRQDLSAVNLMAAARDRAKPPTLRDSTLMVGRAAELANPTQNAGNAANPSAQQGLDMPSEFNARYGQKAQMQNENRPQRLNRDLALNNTTDNGNNWTLPTVGCPSGGTEVVVHFSPLVPVWLPSRGGEDRLLVVRLVHIEKKEFCQGILLDVPALQELLAQQVQDLFPGACVVPMRTEEPPQPELTMTVLPLQLDPADAGEAVASPGWTPLRVGLVLAWAAACVALLAVALGGWSLIDLSERRIRFVSAVTHELRTPLTTLRLYLDMLVGGLVHDEEQRREYLRTLHAETDRLSRLVGNVLDFSRLEKQRPRLDFHQVAVADLLDQVRTTWEGRCHDAGKELVLESAVGAGTGVYTDGVLLQQVLGNLLDNACKYSKGAEDRRLWVRARPEGQRLVLEVEDRGPGVPAGERRSVFRAFRRGHSADVTAGGVGLGLALARRWMQLLGGWLALGDTPEGGGARFQVSLPTQMRGPAGAASRNP